LSTPSTLTLLAGRALDQDRDTTSDRGTSERAILASLFAR
jgi:hypothetical protein